MNDRTKHRIQITFSKILNYILVTVPFGLCWMLYYSKIIVSPFYRIGNYTVILLFFIMFFTFCRVYDANEISLHRISEMYYSQVISFLVSDGFIYLVICILCKRLVTIIPGLLCIAGQFVLAYLWCLFAHKWYFKTTPAKKTIVIYDDREDMEKLINEYGLNKKFKVEKTLQINECMNDITILDRFQAIFLSDIHSHERNIISKYSVEKDKDLYIIPRIGDVILSGAKNMHMFHLPILRLRRYNPHLEYLFAKRCFDIMVAGTAAVILSPFMVITAVAINAYDKGPVLYKQKRLTKNGKIFEILKFRSMRVDAEKYSGAVLSSGDDDPRITPIGRFIRKIRFDELPQLFNILKGDMSIVGPRPERPEIAEKYEKDLPEFRLRLQAKAGLTGYAQVYGKYNTTPYNKLQMDLMYIAHPSFIEDMRICMATIKILFMKESTEGLKSSNDLEKQSENEDNHDG